MSCDFYRRQNKISILEEHAVMHLISYYNFTWSGLYLSLFHIKSLTCYIHQLKKWGRIPSKSPPSAAKPYYLIMESEQSLSISYYSSHWSQNRANFCSQILQENNSFRFYLQPLLNLRLRHKSTEGELLTEWQPYCIHIHPLSPPCCGRKPRAPESISVFYANTLLLALPSNLSDIPRHVYSPKNTDEA